MKTSLITDEAHVAFSVYSLQHFQRANILISIVYAVFFSSPSSFSFTEFPNHSEIHLSLKLNWLISLYQKTHFQSRQTGSVTWHILAGLSKEPRRNLQEDWKEFRVNEVWRGLQTEFTSIISMQSKKITENIRRILKSFRSIAF